MNAIERTIDLATENVERGGKPFSCVVARTDDGRVIAESPNLVQQTNDPTAHAEIIAVRQACQRLGSPSLEGHEVYVLAHPCPMCLGALYYASPDRVVFVVTREEEGRHYRDDQKYFEFENFYDEYAKPWQERRLPMEHRPDEGGVEVYRRWRHSTRKPPRAGAMTPLALRGGALERTRRGSERTIPQETRAAPLRASAVQGVRSTGREAGASIRDRAGVVRSSAASRCPPTAR